MKSRFNPKDIKDIDQKEVEELRERFRNIAKEKIANGELAPEMRRLVTQPPRAALVRGTINVLLCTLFPGRFKDARERATAFLSAYASSDMQSALSDLSSDEIDRLMDVVRDELEGHDLPIAFERDGEEITVTWREDR